MTFFWGTRIFFGSDEDNTIAGTFWPDFIFGRRGNDTIEGGGGNDRIFGGSGNDRIIGGEGSDRLFGQRGNDFIYGGLGNDRIIGGSGNDELIGGSGSDRVFGGSGNDRLIYVASDNIGAFDVYSGGRGFDTLELVLTEGEFSNSALQYELETFQARLDAGHSGFFNFDTLGLRVFGIENLTITVIDEEVEDAAPVAPPMATEIDEDGAEFATNLLDGATDANGDALTIENLDTSVETVNGRVLSLGIDYVLADDDETFTLTEAGRALFNDLAAGETDTVIFNFSVTDGTNSVANTFTLSIFGQNDIAIIEGEIAGNVSEDGVVTTTGLLTISDPDAGQSIFQAQANNAGQFGFFSITAAGLWTYVLNNDAEAVQALGQGETVSETFTVLSADGDTSETITITIAGQNDAAVATDDEFSGDEDTTINGNVLTNDVDIEGDALQIVLVSSPQNGTLTLNQDGSFEYVPADNFNGADSFTYLVNDGTTDGNEATVLLLVNAVNDAPDASTVNNEATIDEDAVLDGTLPIAFDVDNSSDALTFELVGQAPEGLVLNSDGNFTFTPQPDFNGDVSFEYLVRDPGGLASAPQTFIITVNAVNDAPITAGAIAETLSEDAPSFEIDLLSNASDVDGDILNVENFPQTITTELGRVLTQGVDYTLGDDGKTFTFTEAGLAQFNSLTAAQSDTLSEAFEVSDGTVFVANTLSLTIDGENDVATITGVIEGEVSEDQILLAEGQLSIADPDTGEASVIAQADTPGQFGSFSVTADGAWSYVLNNESEAVQNLGAEDIETEQFLVTSVDGSASALITIAINGEDEPIINTAPVANDDTFTGDEDSTISGNVLANDVDAEDDDLIAELISGPVNGVLTFNADGSFNYTPNENFNVTDSFVYVVSDGTLDGNEATVVLTIDPINDDPTTSGSLSQIANEDDASFTLDLLDGAQDVDGDTLSISGVPVITGDLNNGVSITNNLVSVNPAAYDALSAGESVVIAIDYTISDGNGGSVPQSATITIEGADEAGPDTAPPTLSVQLLNDTGFSDSDGITSDSTIVGNVSDPSGVAQLTVTPLDSDVATFVDITSLIQDDGSFSLSLDQLEDIANITIESNVQTFSFGAIDTLGNTTPLQTVAFTLDSEAPDVEEAPTGVVVEAPSTLSIVFNEPIDGDSVDLSNFSVTATNKDGSLSLIEITSIVQETPSQFSINLAGALPNDDYTLSVSPGITDLAGNVSEDAMTFDFTVAATTSVTSVSPSDGLNAINVDREIIVEFDRPIDPTTVDSDTFKVLANGNPVEGFVRVSATNLMATFFLEEGETLPASSNIQIVLDGDSILDAAGEPVDVNGDGVAGGTLQTDFSTVSLTRIPDTNFTATIFDSNRVDEDGNDIPLEGVIVKVVGLPDVFAVTDENGQFTLEDLPVGQVFIEFDATGVVAAEGFQFGTVVEPITTIAGQTVEPTTANGDPFNIFFSSFAESDAVEIVEGQETVVGVGEAGLANLREIFGEEIAAQFELLELTIPADALFDDAQNLATSVTVTVFEPDRIPAPLPQGFDPAVVFTVTADGVDNVDSNAQLTFPNLDGLEPGERRPIYSFDHDAGLWVETGTAVVSADGSVLISEGDGGINTLGWKFLGRNPIVENDEVKPKTFDSQTTQFTIDDAGSDLTTQALREAGAAAGQFGLAGLDLLDALNPSDEFIPPLGAAKSALKFTIGAELDAIDDGSIDPVSTAISGTLATAGTIPLAGFVADSASLGINLGSALQNLAEAAGLASVDSTSGFENLGTNAQASILSGRFGVSESQLLEVAEIAVMNDDNVPLQMLAQTVIDGARGELLDQARERFAEETQTVIETVRPHETSIGIDAQGQPTPAEFQVQQTVEQANQNLNDFDNAIEQAEAEFAEAVENIDTSASDSPTGGGGGGGGGDTDPTEEEVAAQFESAQDEFFEALESAFNDFGLDFEETSTGAIDLTNDIITDFIPEFQEVIESTVEIIRLIEFEIITLTNALEIFESIEEAFAAGEDLTSFTDDLIGILADINDTQAQIEALGASNSFDLLERALADFDTFNEGFNRVTSSFASPVSTDIFARVVFEDGTIVNQVVSIDDPLSVNGTLGEIATVQYFNPETNEFFEGELEFSGTLVDLPPATVFFTETVTTDSDGDGIPDLGEVVIGSDPNSADTDGDGVLDGAELSQGSQVNDDAPLATGVIAGVQLTGETVDIQIIQDADNPEISTAFLATGSNGIAIVDVSAQFNPIILSQLELPGTVVDISVDVSRDLLYASAGDNGLHIIDISDPTGAILLNTLEVPGGAISSALINGLLVIGGGNSLTLADPATGEIIQQIETRQIDDIIVSGGTVFVIERDAVLVPDPPIDFFDDSFSSSGVSLVSFNVAANGIDRLSEVIVPAGASSFVEQSRFELFIDNGIAYVPTALEVAFISSARPAERGAFQTFDVSDPNELSQVSGIDNANVQAGNFDTVTNGSGLAFAAGGTFGIDIFNASDPEQTFDLLDRIDTPGEALGLALSGGFAFVADGSAGLQVVNYINTAVLEDQVAPEISISAPDVDVLPGTTGVQILEGSTIDLGLSVFDDVQVNEVTLFLNGVEVLSQTSAPFDLSFVTPAIANSPNTQVEVFARATDSVGNITQSSSLVFEVVPDTQVPEVLQILPAPGSVIAAGTTQTVSVVLSEPVDETTISRFALSLIPESDPENPLIAQNVSLVTGLNGQQIARFSFIDLDIGDFTISFDPTGIVDLSGNAIGDIPLTQELVVSEFTVEFIGEGDSIYSDAANFSTGALPGVNDVTSINLDPGQTLSVLEPAGFSGSAVITGEGTLSVNTGVFTAALVYTTLDNSANIEILNGGIEVLGAFRNSGDITINSVESLSGGGRIEVSGTLENTGTITIVVDAETGPSVRGASLQANGGGVVFTGGGTIELIDLTEIPSESGFFRDGIFGDFANGFEPITNFDNTITGTGGIGGDARFINDVNGTLLARDGDILSLTGSIAENRGVIQADVGGVFNVISNQAVGFNVAARTNGSLINEGGVLLANGGTINLGDTDVTGGQLITTTDQGEEGLITVGATSEVDGFVLDIVASDFRPDLVDISADARINVEGVVDFGGTISSTQTITVADNSEVTIEGDVVLTGGGVITLTGDVDGNADTDLDVNGDGVLTDDEVFDEVTFTNLAPTGVITSVISGSADVEFVEFLDEFVDEFTGEIETFINVMTVTTPANLTLADQTIEGTGVIGSASTAGASDGGFGLFFEEPEAETGVDLLFTIEEPSSVIANISDEVLRLFNTDVVNRGTLGTVDGVLEVVDTALSNDGLIEFDGGAGRFTTSQNGSENATLTNSGTISVLNDADVIFEQALTNSGLIDIGEGEVTFAEDLVFSGVDGQVDLGNGTIIVDGGVNGEIDSEARFTFTDGDGELVLNSSDLFDASLDDFDVGDLVHLTELDASGDISFAFISDADGGILTVSDGTNDVELSFDTPDSDFVENAELTFVAEESSFGGIQVSTTGLAGSVDDLFT